MIVLKGSAEVFGLPEGSPYVTRTEIHLKMAGLAYTKEAAMPAESPKGQIPFIQDGGQVIADSTFIRFHIEQEFGIDLDAGLDAVQRATAVAIEAVCEHQLVPAVGYFRWLVPANFAKGPAHYFDHVPAEERDGVLAAVLDDVRRTMTARGVARHSEAEIVALGVRSLRTIETLLGDKPYLMGQRPCGADALVFATLAGAMTPFFDSPLRDAAVKIRRLVAYVSRMMDEFYPEFEWDAGIVSPAQKAA